MYVCTRVFKSDTLSHTSSLSPLSGRKYLFEGILVLVANMGRSDDIRSWGKVVDSWGAHDLHEPSERTVVTDLLDVANEEWRGEEEGSADDGEEVAERVGNEFEEEEGEEEVGERGAEVVMEEEIEEEEEEGMVVDEELVDPDSDFWMNEAGGMVEGEEEPFPDGMLSRWGEGSVQPAGLEREIDGSASLWGQYCDALPWLNSPNCQAPASPFAATLPVLDEDLLLLVATQTRTCRLDGQSDVFLGTKTSESFCVHTSCPLHYFSLECRVQDSCCSIPPWRSYALSK